MAISTWRWWTPRTVSVVRVASNLSGYLALKATCKTYCVKSTPYGSVSVKYRVKLKYRVEGSSKEASTYYPNTSWISAGTFESDKDVGVTVQIPLSDYYPNTWSGRKTRYLQGVQFEFVQETQAPKKPSGGSKSGNIAYLSFSPYNPYPDVDYPSFDPNTGCVSFSAQVPKDEGRDVLAKASYKCSVIKYDAVAKKDVELLSGTDAFWKDTTAFGSQWSSDPLDIADYQSLLASDSALTCTVRSRMHTPMGYRNGATRTVTITAAPTPSINGKSFKYDAGGSTSDPSGIAVFGVGFGKNRNFDYADAAEAGGASEDSGVKLQALVNVEYDTAADIPGTAEWADVGSRDNYRCESLTANIADLLPEAGNRSWVRLKAWRFSEDVAALVRYSKPMRLTDLERPAPEPVTARDDACEVVALRGGTDGESVVAVVGWHAQGKADNSNATELAWADSEGAWKSTKQPSTFLFDWADEAVDPAASGAAAHWQQSATVTIAGLKAGELVHVRARRVRADDDATTYGPWSPMRSASVPVGAPTGAVLNMPEVQSPSSDVECSWSLEGGGVQTGYILRTAGGLVISSNDKSTATSYTIPASKARKYAVDGTLSCYVTLFADNGRADSEVASTHLKNPPWLTVSHADGFTLAEQPLSLNLVNGEAGTRVAITVTSRGAGALSFGQSEQRGGDVVYSGVVAPEWELRGGSYYATCELPECDFRDGCEYDVSAAAIDSLGQRSAPTAHNQKRFQAAWSRQAPSPSGDIEFEPFTEVDADGNVVRACRIALAPPDAEADGSAYDATAGDAYDVYRVSHDGAAPIGYGLPLDWEGVDPYAPFGEGSGYEVVLRTPDGDAAAERYPCELDAPCLRVDFGGDYVELPYNLGVDESYEKRFESRDHVDGESRGYWNEGARREVSLSAAFAREGGGDLLDRLHRLARHAGPCFVRTPTGSAFEANVDLDGLDCEGPLFSVSLKAEQVAASGGFELDVEEG